MAESKMEFLLFPYLQLGFLERESSHLQQGLRLAFWSL